ncbi:MAG: serine acetyltransferase [Desulfovibrio sp.]|jgi:serine O-acetyltransferase|nr:serine acetyltransferase [Desulfovibrio sp.]
MKIDKAYPSLSPEFDHVVARLCAPSSLEDIPASSANGRRPSLHELQSIVDRLKTVLLPGYFETEPEAASLRYRFAATLDSIFLKLSEQIFRACCFAGGESRRDAQELEHASRGKAFEFIECLPHIRALLATDVKAAYERDPAATGIGEIIFCYPSIEAMLHHRMAHELHLLEVPLIPRILAENAHRATGIDIHPAAAIGEGFFIDHGTGVVIGETCVVGDCCCLYQGVTLGALSFPRTDDGQLIRGARRHPSLGNRVTVYAGASILGNIHIGSDAVIGANMWVTADVPAKAKLASIPGGAGKNG